MKRVDHHEDFAERQSGLNASFAECLRQRGLVSNPQQAGLGQPCGDLVAIMGIHDPIIAASSAGKKPNCAAGLVNIAGVDAGREVLVTPNANDGPRLSALWVISSSVECAEADADIAEGRQCDPACPPIAVDLVPPPMRRSGCCELKEAEKRLIATFAVAGGKVKTGAAETISAFTFISASGARRALSLRPRWEREAVFQ